MVGDLNQLINDLNNGKSSARAAKFHSSQNNNRNLAAKDGAANSSFEKQAKALYFDIGSGAHEGKVAKTIDFVDNEYGVAGSASSSGGGGHGQRSLQ